MPSFSSWAQPIEVMGRKGKAPLPLWWAMIFTVTAFFYLSHVIFLMDLYNYFKILSPGKEERKWSQLIRSSEHFPSLSALIPVSWLQYSPGVVEAHPGLAAQQCLGLLTPMGPRVLLSPCPHLSR
jgi:hypothetical protein